MSLFKSSRALTLFVEAILILGLDDMVAVAQDKAVKFVLLKLKLLTTSIYCSLGSDELYCLLI